MPRGAVLLSALIDIEVFIAPGLLNQYLRCYGLFIGWVASFVFASQHLDEVPVDCSGLY